MSEESSSPDVSPSPSLLNHLRQFRFQKKDSNTQSSDMLHSPDLGLTRKKLKRILELDPEEEFEDEIDSPVTVNAADIAAREKSLRILVDVFPSVDKMVLQDALVRSKWDAEIAKEDLLKKKYPSQPKRARSDSSPPTNKVKKVKQNLDNIEEDNDDDFEDANSTSFNEKVFNSDESEDEMADEETCEQKTVLEFFSNASLRELITTPFISQKKADCIVEQRPFENWKELVEKLKNAKYLGTELLNKVQDYLHTRQQVELLMQKCMKLSKKMEQVVVAGASSIKNQPSLLTPSLSLTSYQMVGLNWLRVMHDQELNGILADEMGLGKTVQVIAFFAHLKETSSNSKTKHKPHVVVVPSSTLDNWKNELERWCPSLNVVVYYGSQYERKAIRISLVQNGMDDIDVILTTYNVMTSTPEERKMFRVLRFQYVVIDEAHLLKNMTTQRYETLMRINADHRILLTGTPLQNNLIELMSLLIFVMPKMIGGNKEHLKSLFSKCPKQNGNGNVDDEEGLPKFEQDQVAQARKIMKPFVLRRLKEDVLKDLPPKTDETMTCPLYPSQKEKYDELIKAFQRSAGDETEASDTNCMTMMMQLRKMSNHPLLLRYHYQEAELTELAKVLARDPTYKTNDEQHVLEDLLFMSDFELHTLTRDKDLDKFYLPVDLIYESGKFKIFDQLLPELKNSNHRVVMFSQFVIMLDVIEEYLTLRDHRYLRLDGSTPVPIRQELIDDFTNDSSIFIFLVSTRAGGIGINLTAADTVIIHDIDFNPHNDRQAEDRCHRVGQSKDVRVIKMISEGTIEEGIYQKAQEKLTLEREITSEDCKAAETKNVLSLLKQTLGIESKVSHSSKKT